MPERFSSYREAIDYLFKSTDYERMARIRYNTTTFDLRRMERLLDGIGNPHLGLQTVHITGTKGKGSTAHMIASIAAAAGLKVGLFTSPHLVELEERISINSTPIPREGLRQLIDFSYPHIEKMKLEGASAAPTFFEIITCLALLHFKHQEVDLAVMEVGLGGRLDATNVIAPLVCVITPISIDHTLQLGGSLPKIAREKAGIIKPGVPVVSAPQGAEALEVIEEVCQERCAPLYLVGRDEVIKHTRMLSFPQVGARFSLRAKGWHLEGLEISLVGRHQVENAAAAVGAVRILREQGFEIRDCYMRAGLKATRVPARVEVVSTSPLLILDGAHNVASMRALVTALEGNFPPRKRVLLLGIAKDKDVKGVLREIVPGTQKIVVTGTGSPRAADPGELAEKCRKITSAPVKAEPDIPKAFDLARRLTGKDGLLVITGSFYLAGEIKKMLREATPAA